AVELESERARLREAERRHRILSEISATLLDYVGGDEGEPLRRIVHRVVEGLGDWCAFSLVDSDGILRRVAAYHPDPRQRALADRASLAVRNARLVRELAAERDRQQVARQEAERQAAELWAMFEGAPNGLLLFDQEDRLRYVSRRMLEMFHWVRLQDFVGKGYDALFEQDVRGDGKAHVLAEELREIL